MNFERAGVSWSKIDIDCVLLNYHDKTDAEIGQMLNRSPQAITKFRLKKMRLRKGYKIPKCLIAINEAKIEQKVAKMKELVHFCETSTNPYKIDQAKIKLRKLSGL